ncbi:hypothetical protein RchiOBHm_Chr6g0265571 [Rosa chinensis]|uniref:Uncharacterized protein n=1 Tax=Rosa chinensis TaxID=74649 RepID=A0A2P6PPI0_ROSCH|nr:hypothetical protein RchiOBHm_Chr6g0265571 [Rosa chinensis]
MPVPLNCMMSKDSILSTISGNFLSLLQSRRIKSLRDFQQTLVGNFVRLEHRLRSNVTSFSRNPTVGSTSTKFVHSPRLKDLMFGIPDKLGTFFRNLQLSKFRDVTFVKCIPQLLLFPALQCDCKAY